MRKSILFLSQNCTMFFRKSPANWERESSNLEKGLQYVQVYQSEGQLRLQKFFLKTHERFGSPKKHLTIRGKGTVTNILIAQ